MFLNLYIEMLMTIHPAESVDLWHRCQLEHLENSGFQWYTVI